MFVLHWYPHLYLLHDTDIKGTIFVWVYAWWSSVWRPGALGHNPSKCAHILPMKWTFQGQLHGRHLCGNTFFLRFLFCVIFQYMFSESCSALFIQFLICTVYKSAKIPPWVKFCKGQADWQLAFFFHLVFKNLVVILTICIAILRKTHWCTDFIKSVVRPRLGHFFVFTR